MGPATCRRSCPQTGRRVCSATPDAEVVLAVAAGRIDYRAARYVGVGDEVGWGGVARRRLPGSGPVYLIDELPPLQVERLGDRRQLVLPGPDASASFRIASRASG